MDQYFLPNDSKAERLKVLRDNAERSEAFTYPKELSKEELDNLKDQLSQDHIKLSKFDEKKKEFNEQYKVDTKPLKNNIKGTITKLRSKVEEVEEEVFLVADHDENVMCYYNADGNLVHFRQLNPDERQFRIVDHSRTGTSNQ